MAAGYSVTFSVVDNATKQIDGINRRIQQMRAPFERMAKVGQKFIDVTGLRRVADGFSWVARSIMGVGRALLEVIPGIGILTGAATFAGIVKLTSAFARWNRELTTTADTLGMTPQQLENFQDAARLAGSSADDMTNSMKSLQSVTGQAFLQRTGQAYADLQRLQIDLTDGAGRLRSAADLLPEVVKKIAAIENPVDRARVATELLGPAGEKMVAAFRTSGGSLEGFLTKARDLAQLTDQQRESLNKFQQAEASLGVTFGHLGEQISAVTAQHLTPFMEKLDAFVKQHTPQITQAIGRIEDKFGEWFDKLTTWIGTIDWGKVVAGIENVAAKLGALIDQFVNWLTKLDWTQIEKNLAVIVAAITPIIGAMDHVHGLGLDIADMFAIAWGVKIVKTLGLVTEAFGVSGGAAGGTGMLGKLGMVLATANLISLAMKSWEKVGVPIKPEELPAGSPFWRDMPEEEQLKYPNSPASQARARAQAPGFFQAPGTYLRNRLFGYPGAGGEPMPGTLPEMPPQVYSPISGLTVPGPRLPQPGGGAGATAFAQAGLARATDIRDRLMRDLDLSKGGAAGLVGNLAAETAGITGEQEKNPIAGRGGIGWAQWTGSRRLDFEAYQRTHPGMSWDDVNYNFLTDELKKPENADVLAQLRRGDITPGVAADVVEKGYERPAPGSSIRRETYAGQIYREDVRPAAPPMPTITLPPSPMAALPDITAPAPAVPAGPAAPAPAPAAAVGAPLAFSSWDKPTNGRVDIGITHNNAPPGTKLAATATGDGLNLEPPRREFQSLTAP